MSLARGPSVVFLALCTLACAGLGTSDPVPEIPIPEVPEVPPPNPLVMNTEYWFDHDRANRPEWDSDQRLMFRQSDNCKLKDVEDTYTCTYSTEWSEGAWTVTLTAFTQIKGPDGQRRDLDRKAGDRFTVSADGQTLTRTDGMTFELVQGR